MAKTDYTREELVAICEKAIVLQDKWSNRDSESSQKRVGRCWRLLKCGCKFHVVKESDDKDYHTTEKAIIIKFWVRNYLWFEDGMDVEETDKDGYEHDSNHESLLFYLPQPKRISETGEDWY